MVAVVYYISTSLNRFLLRFFDTQVMIKTGVLLILVAGISMLLSKMLFNTLNLYVIFIPMLVATFAQALIWSISVAFALKDLSHIAGTASSIFSFLQMILSALISGLIAIPHEYNQIPLALVLIGLAIIAGISFNGYYRRQLSILSASE